MLRARLTCSQGTTTKNKHMPMAWAGRNACQTLVTWLHQVPRTGRTEAIAWRGPTPNLSTNVLNDKNDWQSHKYYDFGKKLTINCPLWCLDCKSLAGTGWTLATKYSGTVRPARSRSWSGKAHMIPWGHGGCRLKAFLGGPMPQEMTEVPIFNELLCCCK